MLAGIRRMLMRRHFIGKHCKASRRELSIRSSNFPLLKVGAVAILANLFLSGNVFAFSNSPECVRDLRGLIVPPLKHVVMEKSTMQAEIEDAANGVYSARLFVPADSPDNLDKQVSIGWVNLDVKRMKAFDVTNDPGNKVELKINRDFYTKYVGKCIFNSHVESAVIEICDVANKNAAKSETLIPGYESGREVVGRGRLQFYSAPDERCKIPSVFIVSNEKVDAHSVFGNYTFVDYFNSKTGSNSSGWVRSNRLKPNGISIEPHQ
jgi:hypothetical protein